MNNLLPYLDSSDNEIYLKKDFVEIGLSISACTVKNSDNKPNEDAFIAINHNNTIWAAVFDGTTSLKPIPKLNGETGARFASHFLKNKFCEALKKEDTSPKKVLLELNRLLLKQVLLLDGSLTDTHSLPAAMSTVVKLDINNKNMSFAHVGDTYGIIYKDEENSLFTDDKNKKFDNEIFDLIQKVATNKQISIRQARQDSLVNKKLYEMLIKRNNNSDGSGSGVVNGDPNMEKYMQTGEISLDKVNYVFLASDGMEIQGFDIVDQNFRNKLLSDYKLGGFKNLIKQKKLSEDNDENWNFIRYKHSDDATGIMLEMLTK